MSNGNHPKSLAAYFVAISIVLVVLFAIIIAILPPSARSTPSSRKQESQNNLFQIYTSMRNYTEDYHGQYPDSFGTLLLFGDVTSNLYVIPDTTDTPAEGPTTQAMLANLSAPGHCAYVYLGRGMTTQTADANTVIIYEKPGYFSDGGNVLYGDGHVQFVDVATLKQIAAMHSGS